MIPYSCLVHFKMTSNFNIYKMLQTFQASCPCRLWSRLKNLSCCATPVGRLYSRTLLLPKKSAVQQFLPLRFRVRLAAGERPASHLSSSVSFIYFHWRKLRVGFPLAKVCMYTYSLFKSSAIPQNIAQHRPTITIIYLIPAAYDPPSND